MALTLPVLRGWLGVTRALAETQWFGIHGIAAGVFGVPAGLFVLVVVSWATRPPPATTGALIDRMRFPDVGGER